MTKDEWIVLCLLPFAVHSFHNVSIRFLQCLFLELLTLISLVNKMNDNELKRDTSVSHSFEMTVNCRLKLAK